MYGDDYLPKNPEVYAEMLRLFEKCDTAADVSMTMMLFLLDPKVPKADIHVAHKRAYLLKGWEP
jgi:hypothetical protein